MTLYLIRHAHAGQAHHDDPDDHLRPLSRKGQKQAEALAQALAVLEVRCDRLFSSPYTRAAETAAPLTPYVRGGRSKRLTELTQDDPPALVGALRKTLADTGTDTSTDVTVALVGHEPYLSSLTSYLLSGSEERVRVRFRKGMLVRLDGPLKAGHMELHSALPPNLIKQLAK